MPRCKERLIVIEQLESLREWDIAKYYSYDGLHMLLGERGKGKTTFAEYISQLDPLINKSIMVVMCGSEKVRQNWYRCVPRLFVMLPSIEFLEELMMQQDIHIKNYEELGQTFPDHLRVTVILDDIALDSNMMNSQKFRQIVAISRQKYCRFVVLAQNISQIHKRNRRAFDTCGVCGLQNRESLTELWSLYGSFTDKERFIALGMMYTQKKGQMFIIDKTNTELFQLNYEWPFKKTMRFGLPSQQTHSDKVITLRAFDRKQKALRLKAIEKSQQIQLKRTNMGQKNNVMTKENWNQFYKNQSGTTFVVGSNHNGNKNQIRNQFEKPVDFYVDMNLVKEEWLKAIQTNISFCPEKNPFAYNYFQFTFAHKEQERLEKIKKEEIKRLVEEEKQMALKMELKRQEEIKQEQLEQENRVFRPEIEYQEKIYSQKQQLKEMNIQNKTNNQQKKYQERDNDDDDITSDDDDED